MNLRAAVRRENRGPLPRVGYRAGYLRLLAEPIRERLRAILADQFEPEPEEHHAVALDNLLTAIAHVKEPLLESDCGAGLGAGRST